MLRPAHLLTPLTLLLAALAGGCGSSTGSSDTAAKPAASAPAPAKIAAGPVTIDIKDFKYAPPAVTVKAGAKVTWVNKDSAPHTATTKTGPAEFDTGTLKQSDTKTVTLSKAGRYAYYCAFHPFMKGTVTVTG